MEVNGSMQPEADRAGLRIARMIGLALPMGVVTFWVIGWVMTDGGARGLAQGGPDAGVVFWAWAGLALAGFAAALVLRGRAAAIAEDAARAGTPGARGGEVQATLIIAWALLEAQALLAGVLLLLYGLEQIVLYAAIVYAIGLVLTFPRAEWWGVGGGMRADQAR